MWKYFTLQQIMVLKLFISGVHLWFKLVTFRSLSSPEPFSLSLSVTRSLHLRSMELLGYGSSVGKRKHQY